MPDSPFDLAGRVALVTGAYRGLGFAIARGLAQAGATVILNGRKPAELAEAAGKLVADGLAADVAMFDVTRRDAVQAAVAAWAGDKPVAVISVDQSITKRGITDLQLEALRLFAGYAGLAIENSRLNEALQHELKLQIQAEENEANRRAMLEKIVLLGQQVT